MTKPLLRRRILALCKALSPEERTRLSRGIVSRLISHRLFTEAREILAFMPLPSEPDLLPVLEAAFSAGKKAALPRVEKEGIMRFHSVASLDGLAENRWGIREPSAETPLWQPPSGCREGELLVLVPGVAFDRKGKRVGRGGGYYDRFLATLPDGAVTAALCYPHQILPEVPSEAHDADVQWLFSSEEIIGPLT